MPNVSEPKRTGRDSPTSVPCMYACTKPRADSSRETSSSLPRPVRATSWSPALIAPQARYAAAMSMTDPPHRTGGRPASPVMPIIPLKACIIES